MRLPKMLAVLLILTPVACTDVGAQSTDSWSGLIDSPRTSPVRPSAFVTTRAKEWFQRYLDAPSRRFEYAAPHQKWEAARSLARALLTGLEGDEQGFMCFDLVQSHSTGQVILTDVAEASAAIEHSDFFARSFRERIEGLQSAIRLYRGVGDH